MRFTCYITDDSNDLFFCNLLKLLLHIKIVYT